MDAAWTRMAADDRPSWYLHPLVARQKRDTHLRWLRQWRAHALPGLLLKTDLFEDAYGDDTLLPALLGDFPCVAAFDWLPLVVRRAQERFSDATLLPFVADCRTIPLASASVSVVYSPSTLDHFETHEALHVAIEEIARVLPVGGLLLITFDNPRNPLYWVLRVCSRMGWTPYPLGVTPSPTALDRQLVAAGFEVLGREYLIHNPRGISTALFMMLHALLGQRADPVIAFLLAGFERLSRLPTRVFSACFVATCARKRESRGHAVAWSTRDTNA